MAAIGELGVGKPIPCGMLPRLRGRLLFSWSLCFGRFGGNALRALGEASAGGCAMTRVSNELAHALTELKAFLQLAPPREIRLAHDGCPVLLTDGAFEPGVDGRPAGGIGGVLLDPADKSYMYFSLCLPESFLDTLMAGGAKNVIGQLEIAPVVVARKLWSSRLRGRSHFSFIDNEGARCNLVAGYSPNIFSAALVSSVAASDLQDSILAWYDRVPSAANLSDAPSRMVAPVAVPSWPAPQLVEVSDDVISGLEAIVQGCRGLEQC